MTDIECSVIALLADPKTCTELGEQLWGQAHCNRQSYARPAGKIILRLIAAGSVERVFPDGWQDRAPIYAAKKCESREAGKEE